MKKPKDTQTLSLLQDEANALSVIRTETALSRFPMHRLSKGREVQIEIKNQGGAVYWNVSHNSKYGQPGQLAYKIDTLLINRRIEEAGKPAPKVIRLGTLSEIAQELGSASHNWNAIKQALAQNATASVTAKINYRTQEQGERWLEAVFNRYSVIFTGETLPSGLIADAVYIVLNDIYQEILNTAVFRPLDYDYMKSLPPAAQRFYEIASYQIFAAVHHNNPRAKVRYSEYCLLSTATRYFTFDQVKKQMYKVLKPHTQSGYLSKISYEATTTDSGEADWWMYFTPGPNAGREYAAFTEIRREGRKAAKALPKGQSDPSRIADDPEEAAPLLPLEEFAGFRDTQDERPQLAIAASVPPASVQPSNDNNRADTQELIGQLVQADLNRGDAERFAREKPAVCQRQLAYLPYVHRFKSSRGAYLRRAIEGDYGPPAAYAKAQAQQEAAHALRQSQANQALQASEAKARQSHEKRFYAAYCQFLVESMQEAEKTQPEAFMAFKTAEEEQRQRLLTSPLADRPLFRESIARFDTPEQRGERYREFCAEEGHKLGITAPDFWEWDARLNPNSFRL